MSTHSTALPVGGPIFTRPFRNLVAVATIGLAVIVWRFAVGLGPATGLSDGYPWGIWIAFDVVTSTALACGGYAVALLVYVLNQGRYHPLVRPAVLTSALGYSLAGFAIAVDVGRPWFMYRIPIRFRDWNLNSALLEVALCVMAYIVVLWIELSPAAFEKWKAARGSLPGWAAALDALLHRSMVFVLALGLLLPTMHQSSLGTVMLIAGPRLHPVWASPIVPLMFLVSCMAMGYAAVVLESSISTRVFGRARETAMLAKLSRAMVVVVGLFLALRFGDLVVRGAIVEVFAANRFALWFWFETALFVVPLVLLLQTGKLERAGHLFRAAVLLAFGGAAYRFGTYLVAFLPGEQYSYVPTVPELVVTVGIVALEVALYVLIVKTFPILGGAPAAPATARRTAP